MRADELDLPKEVGCSLLDDRDLPGVQVSGVSLESTWLHFRVDCYLLERGVVDSDESIIPTDPNRASDVLRRDGVVSILEGDVAVAMDLSFAFLEARKVRHWEWRQLALFVTFEQRTDLLASRAVDSRVRYVFLPVGQISVLLLDTSKRSAFQSILLRIVDASLDLSFVTRGVGSCR